MLIVVKVLIGLVAFLHVFFFVLEAFLWTKPSGRKVFRTTADFARQSSVLAWLSKAFSPGFAILAKATSAR